MCIGKKKISILILSKGPTLELDDTKLTYSEEETFCKFYWTAKEIFFKFSL